jgi:GH15 family glucan-1,4-alpha-glucosidase
LRQQPHLPVRPTVFFFWLLTLLALTLATPLILRYDTEKVNDGVGGSEGAFSLCTLWGVEALARAGAYEPALLPKATAMLVRLYSLRWSLHPSTR